MARASRDTNVVAPLLVWRELDAIETMRVQHREIRQAASSLRPHCRRRIILEARLADLTLQILKAELALRRTKTELH